jgi:hypothetical protein
MNIFYTNSNSHLAANELCRVHQIKMILEYSQLLSAAHHIIDSSERVDIYKLSHANHPSALWVRSSRQHYEWLYKTLRQLHKLFSDHGLSNHSGLTVAKALKAPPVLLADMGFHPPPVAAPIEFKRMVWDGSCTTEQAYQAYLNYKFAEWQSRDKPIKLQWTTRTPSWVNTDLLR